MLTILRAAIVATALATGAVTTVPAPASAAAAALDRTVAYVRNGDIYTAVGTTERRVTTGGGHSRPRWSPDGRRLAFLRAGLLWVMNADGTAKRRLTARPAAGPAWSPDGRWIAFASAGCLGGPAVYRISTTSAGAVESVLFPAACRGEAAPAVAVAPRAASGSLADRLRTDDAVAWSPDGARIAFRGGDCESVFDACLSLGNIATGGERVLAAYGGGGQEYSGFAVVPSFRSDGRKVAWTAYQLGHDAASTVAVHVVEHDVASGSVRRVGAVEDRELVYAGTSRALVTGRHRGGSWVMDVNLGTGARKPLRQGSQPTVRP